MTPQPHIVCDPNPFCYGSISALRAIAAELPEARLTVLASGPVQDQVDTPLFQRVIPCDVKDPLEWARVVPQFGPTDLYLAVSNNTNVPAVLELGLPLLFVDILFWMKRGVTPAMRRARGYAIERFPGVDEALARVGSPAAGASLVGPLVAPERPRQLRESSLQLLVNLGGASSPDLEPGRNTDYPWLMVQLAGRVVRRLGLEPSRVLVAMGSEAVASVLCKGEPPIPICTLDQDAYLAALASAERFLTAPGLNAPFEAFRFGVPTSFLPPQNLTQVCQLVHFQRADLAPPGSNLSELLPELPIDPRPLETQGTAQVLEALRALQARPDLQRHIERQVIAQLARSPEDNRQQTQRQRDFLAGLGEPGGPAVAELARRCLWDDWATRVAG
jgi:hypothetical protein